MKKKIGLVLAAPAALVCVSAGPALAGNGHGYGEQPGFNVATSHTACAGHGAFGAFGGKDNNFAGGADGRQTAINNSTLCGNPQGH